MKHITLLLASFLMVHSFVFSQKLSKDFKVTTAKPYPVIDAGSKEYLSLDNGYALMVKMGKGIVNIQKFDVNDMKEVTRKTYKDLPPKAVFQDVIKLEGRVFYIYEAEDKKAKNFKVYSREINTENATFEKQTVLFTTSRKVVNSPSTGELTRLQGPFMNLRMSGNKFLVYKSFDESKVMINYRCAPIYKDDSKNYDEIGFYVFDNKMQKLWGKEVKMPYTEKEMDNIAYSISSSGNAKMLVVNKKDKAYEVFLVDNPGDLTIKKLGLPTDKLVRHMKIKENKDGNFICGGYYANGIEFNFNFWGGGALVFNANGLMYFEMDKDGNLLENKTFDFSKEFIQQNLNDRQKKAVEKREAEGKAGILDLILTNFIIKPDGSSYFIGERQYVRNELWGLKTQQVFHFSNVIVIKVDKDGNLAWMKKLPKNQAGIAGCGQMSFAYMEGKTADYVAYVDNPKNIALGPNDGIPAAHKDGMGGFLTTYKIDHETGNLEKHTICDLKDINGVTAYQFKTWRIFRAGVGVFLMEIYIKGKKDTMVKFELQ